MNFAGVTSDKWKKKKCKPTGEKFRKEICNGTLRKEKMPFSNVRKHLSKRRKKSARIAGQRTEETYASDAIIASKVVTRRSRGMIASVYASVNSTITPKIRKGTNITLVTIISNFEIIALATMPFGMMNIIFM